MSIEVATVDDDGTETRTYLVRDAVEPVGWAVAVGDLVAEGTGTTVVCNVAAVEQAARERLERGEVAVTPTGPWLDLPNEAATYLAFLGALSCTCCPP